MNEFNNRIDAQRQILGLINQQLWEKEELFGLSTKAIERWASINRIESEAPIVQLVLAAASKLFFLANKSQEQISAEYQTTSNEIRVITEKIKSEIEKIRANQRTAFKLRDAI